MTQTLSKNDLLMRLHEERNQLDGTLATLSDAQLVQTGATPLWSSKDTLAHLAFWNRWTNDRIDKISRSEKPPRLTQPGELWNTTLERVNTQVFGEHRDQSLADVRADYDDSIAGLIALIDRLSDEQLAADSPLTAALRRPPLDMIYDAAPHHWRFHHDLILLWLDEASGMSKRGLLAHIRVAYFDFENLLRNFTPEQMTQPNVEGVWSIKDILAHLISWHGFLLRELDTIARGDVLPTSYGQPGETWAATMDRWNAEAVAQRADHSAASAAEVQAELKQTYEQVLAHVESFGEARLLAPVEDGSTELLWQSIRGNTYEHYIEHAQVITRWLAGLSRG